MYELERLLVVHAYIAWIAITARVEAFCREAPLPSIWPVAVFVFYVHTLPSCLLAHLAHINERAVADIQSRGISVWLSSLMSSVSNLEGVTSGS